VQQFLEIWQAMVLGLVEGITEYLPISSTGHLILASGMMGLDEPESRKSAVDAFNVVVQGGAILAVIGLYRATVVRMARGLLGKDRLGRSLLINVMVAFMPAAVMGLLLDDWIEAHLFHAFPVVLALFAGGVYMLWLERWRRRRNDFAEGSSSQELNHRGGANRFESKYEIAQEDSVLNVTLKQALTIGCLQVLAMWPGTSRSMMTITGGVLAGLKPRPAAEFSFLLGAFTLTAASGYKLAKNLYESHETGAPNLFQVLGVVPVLIGILVATISAFLAVKWLVHFLNRYGLALFGWYRIALALLLGGAISMGIVQI
jgi:undecaprenyl-diphosphatase